MPQAGRSPYLSRFRPIWGAAIPLDAQLSSCCGRALSEYIWGSPVFLASLLGLSFRCPKKQESKSQTQTAAKASPTSPCGRTPRPCPWSGGRLGNPAWFHLCPDGADVVSRAAELFFSTCSGLSHCSFPAHLYLPTRDKDLSRLETGGTWWDLSTQLLPSLPWDFPAFLPFLRVDK